MTRLGCCHYGLCGRSRHGCRVTPLFASLHRATPQLAKRGVARDQRVVMIALGKGERAIIPDTFDNRFDAALRVVRWTLGRAVEIDIKLHLKATYVLLKTPKLLFNRRLLVGCREA